MAEAEFLDDFAVAIQGGGVPIIGNDHGSALAFDDIADGNAVIFVHTSDGGSGGIRAGEAGSSSVRLCRQAAHFKNQGRSGIIVSDDLGAGRFAVVIVTEPATDTEAVAGEARSRRETNGRHPSDECPGCRHRH